MKDPLKLAPQSLFNNFMTVCSRKFLLISSVAEDLSIVSTVIPWKANPDIKINEGRSIMDIDYHFWSQHHEEYLVPVQHCLRDSEVQETDEQCHS